MLNNLIIARFNIKFKKSPVADDIADAAVAAVGADSIGLENAP